MTVTKALECIRNSTGEVPADAFRILLEKSSESVPELLRLLRDAAEQGKKSSLFCTLLLLAQLESGEAFPVFIELLEQERMPESIYGNIHIRDILWSIYNGKKELLTKTIKNPDMSWRCKAPLLELYIQLYLDSVCSREELCSFFRDMIASGEYYEETDPATLLADWTCRLHLIELLPDIRFLFRKNRVNEFACGEYDACVDKMFYYGQETGEFCRKVKDAFALWTSLREASGKDKKRGEHNPFPPYPQSADSRMEGRIYLEDFYNQKSLRIDKLVYHAMKRQSDMAAQTEEEMEESDRTYLWQAFEMLQEYMESEGLLALSEFEESCAIHFETDCWLHYLGYLLEKEGDASRKRELDEFLASYEKSDY